MTSLLPNVHMNLVRYYSIIPPQFNNRTFSIGSSNSQLQKQEKILPSLIIHCNLSSPPKSKEEAIRQAKTCLTSTLEKPLNNPKLAAGKIKKLKQPRFRVEIPVIDDSPDSLSQLALQMFDEMPLKRKGSKVKILILWPNSTLTEAANKLQFGSVEHLDISSLMNIGDNVKRVLNSAEVVVFLTPEASQVEVMETVTNSLYPKPVVIFNPRWSYDDEESNLGDFMDFLGSFEVVYSFMGLEVRGLLSKRNGVVFKCVRDGVLSGERWSVLVEEDGELKVISRFKTRPSITEVENVLYNLMAINSPITKSAKFLKGLVSNVSGKKYLLILVHHLPINLFMICSLSYTTSHHTQKVYIQKPSTHMQKSEEPTTDCSRVSTGHRFKGHGSAEKNIFDMFISVVLFGSRIRVVGQHYGLCLLTFRRRLSSCSCYVCLGLYS